MSTERELLTKILKNWAQEHNVNYVIADPDLTDESVTKTGGYLSWIVKNNHANLDLLALLDRLEIFLINRHKKRPLDGLFCTDCGTFYQYAEPNQEDGSLLCYVCRVRPY